MKLNDGKRRYEFRFITTRDGLNDLMDELKEESCSVPEIVLVSFDLDVFSMKRLRELGVENIYHSMSIFEKVDLKLSVIGLFTEQCREEVFEETEKFIAEEDLKDNDDKR